MEKSDTDADQKAVLDAKDQVVLFRAALEGLILRMLNTAYQYDPEAVKRWVCAKWPGGIGLY